MGWTDRHCRVFHRQLAPNALLFTEMITAEALIHGDLEKLLDYDPIEQPLVLQLGGCEPDKLGLAGKHAASWGFSEINLNVGCPSDRVQAGNFGACLMAKPELVAECCQAIMASCELPVTVKCRIGIDDMDPETGLDNFVDRVSESGVRVFYLHARKAWLSGLSPKENRNAPPLDYDRAFRLAKRREDLSIILNGGLQTKNDALLNGGGFAGVMLGRSAYRTPYILAELQSSIFGTQLPDRHQIVASMACYAKRMSEKGTSLTSITRHMFGLHSGQSGARKWRHRLGEESRKADDPKIFLLEASDDLKQWQSECQINRKTFPQ